MRRVVVGTLVAALALTACSSPPAPTGTPPTTTAALRPLDRAALDKVVADTATQLLQPGMVVIVRTPAGEYVNAHGVTEWKGTTPVTADTKVRVGSATKTMTATVILQMVQEGKLALTDPVSRYVPGVPNGDAITIAQLGEMRSGLFNYTETLALNTALDTDRQKVWTDDELLAPAFANPPYFPPGQGWHYSNTNLVLLGMIAEKLDGKPLGRILQDRLFTPLGMTGTSYPDAADTALPEPFAHGYMFGSSVAQMTNQSLPPDQLAQVQAGTLVPADRTADNPSWTGAAGRAVSTANDLATWVKAMVSGTLLDAATQKARMDSSQPTGTGSDYGFGISQVGPLLGHTGALPGWNTFIGYDAANDVTIVVWGNNAPAANGYPPAEALAAGLIPLVYS